MNESFIRSLCEFASEMEGIKREAMFPMPEIKNKDPLRKKLQEMFCESTGAHVLDSGSAYGRGWERARKRKFDDEPEAKFEVRSENGDVKELLVYVNTYHWLVARLELPDDDDPIKKLWEEWIAHEDSEDMSWPETMRKFPEFCESRDVDVQDLWITLTYNHESCLDNGLQFADFYGDGESYVLLQIHNGCDIRGGYTAPALFRCYDESMLNYANASISCDHCGSNWYTNDDWHWYEDWVKEDDTTQLDLELNPVVDPNQGKRLEERTDLRVDENENVICPICRRGKLNPHPY